MPSSSARVARPGHLPATGSAGAAPAPSVPDDPMIHPHTQLSFISDEIGWGVVATRAIPRGTITWALDDFDRVMTRAEVAALPPHYRSIVDRYAYLAPDGTWVLCWDFGRFVNHSCEPTSRSLGANVEIALRDIVPGDQLTSDYGELNLTEQLACGCGAGRCRGTIGRDDALKLWREWDRAIQDALPWVRGAEQPLWPFVRDPERVEAMVEGRLRVPSTRAHHVPDDEGATG